jgi:SAM-dependent methyltransferase
MTPVAGSADKWGPLWGAQPRAWAEDEEKQVPTYEEAIRRIGVAPGERVLDIGCGTGVFLRLVADHGAKPFGLDASEALLEIAHERVPEADLQVGEMEQLPYHADSFDLVTGFNSFFFAADMVAALREARRVAKPGASVVIQVWGRPERCDLEAQKQVARRYAPSPPPDAPPPPQLWEPGVLEGLASEAGLTPESAFDTSYAFEYPGRGNRRPLADRTNGSRRAGRTRAGACPATRHHRGAGGVPPAQRQLPAEQRVSLPDRACLTAAPARPTRRRTDSEPSPRIGHDGHPTGLTTEARSLRPV